MPRRRSMLTALRYALLLPLVVGPLCVLAADDKADAFPPALTDARTNSVWQVQGRRADELVYTPGTGREPILTFNSRAFRGRDVTVEVTTDSRTFILSNSAGEIELRLLEGDRYRLTLGGAAAEPVFDLNGKPLFAHKPTSDRILNDDRDHTFRMILRGATEATVKLKTRHGKVKLREEAAGGDGAGS